MFDLLLGGMYRLERDMSSEKTTKGWAVLICELLYLVERAERDSSPFLPAFDGQKFHLLFN